MLDAKKIIVETALAMGFENAVVAGLEPMQAERLIYEAWLNNGYAASMHYLKRDPSGRNNPRLLCPEAYSAVLLFASYYTEVPPDPGPEYGKVARYAVGRDYHLVLPQKLTELKARIEEKLQRPLLGKYFTDDVKLFEQGLASRHGLGFIGKNSLLIGPRLSGSYHFVAEFFTDLALEPDLPYEGTCGQCFRCGDICPTAAIVSAKTVDANLCISFLTIENKADIPLSLREKLGSWLFGCDLCQEVCPYNQRPPQTRWLEFQPESGVGHYLNLFDILRIEDKKHFLSLFGETPLSRPKRKGLIRNALVVLGNRQPPHGPTHLCDFIDRESDPLLIEHAVWALARFENGKKLLHKSYERCRHDELKTLFEPYLS